MTGDCSYTVFTLKGNFNPSNYHKENHFPKKFINKTIDQLQNKVEKLQTIVTIINDVGVSPQAPLKEKLQAMAPFYQKYKDVSITNNSSAIKGKAYNSILYTPSDNPFEAYNMLERTFSDCKSICISPLGSKPVSLGVCLYALDHEDVRIVYPVSESYSHHLTNNVIKTWVYDIPCTTV